VAIKDRIKELRRVKAKQLRPSPKNWRLHSAEQREALRGILHEIGWAGASIARELPDGNLELIDGHLRADLDPEADVPVLVLDLDEAEAAKVLATFDPLGAMAGKDQEKLDALIGEVSTEAPAVQKLLAEMGKTGAAAVAEGEPEIKISPELHERHDYLVITVENQLDWQVLCERLGIDTVANVQADGSTLNHRGTGRVVTAQRLLQELG